MRNFWAKESLYRFSDAVWRQKQLPLEVLPKPYAVPPLLDMGYVNLVDTLIPWRQNAVTQELPSASEASSVTNTLVISR